MKRVYSKGENGVTAKIDLEFRPHTYWNEAKRAVANVCGTHRRNRLTEALARGQRDLPQGLLADSIDEASKNFLGSIHPALRSGEDLRPVRRRETEIARIRLTASVHCEVTSLRARQVGDRIAYSIEDEILSYESGKFFIKPQSSKQPLTLGQLVDFINTAEFRSEDGLWSRTGLVVPFWEQQLEAGYDDDEAFSFVSVTSEFYPQIGRCFAQQFEAWVGDRSNQTDNDTDEDESGDDNPEEAI